MFVSVVSATYNRAELLDNALYTYSKQSLPVEKWEYLICDDMSSDNTKEVVEKWIEKGLPLRYFTSEELGRPKKEGEWRDGCALRNSLSTWAFGRVIIGTHPEIMIRPDTLEVMYNLSMENPDKWITAVPYWMPYGKLPKGWKSDLSKINTMEGFYDPSWPDELTSPGAVDYRNQFQEVRPTWESEVFWAMQMSKWRWMGGFREFTVWGSVDMDFLSRRAKLNIKTLKATVDGKNLMVYHQNHESKRDMKLAHQALKGTTYTPQSARTMGGLFNVYNHGHRERTMGNDLEGILGDHISRYEFAKGYSNGKAVLDIPCGTGYGSHVLYKTGPRPSMYLGQDIDQESIDFANRIYVKNKDIAFVCGDMVKIMADDNQFDMIVSFEGLEHISSTKRKKFVAEMKRVLKPGGTIIISTPQKDAAKGTPWDKYVMTKEELKKLFSDWKNVDWFYQHHYGAKSTPIPTSFSALPVKAEIMILGATVDKSKKIVDPDTIDDEEEITTTPIDVDMSDMSDKDSITPEDVHELTEEYLNNAEEDNGEEDETEKDE